MGAQGGFVRFHMAIEYTSGVCGSVCVCVWAGGGGGGNRGKRWEGMGVGWGCNRVNEKKTAQAGGKAGGAGHTLPTCAGDVSEGTALVRPRSLHSHPKPYFYRHLRNLSSYDAKPLPPLCPT